MVKNIRYILFALAALIPFYGFGQLNVNTAVTANQLISSLIGNGLTVSNISLNCPAGAYGTFSNGNATNLGINNGILLTTGTAAGVPGANTSASDVSFCSGPVYNDPDLVALDPSAVNDACILEFDIVPKCDSLTIRFVFGSEEYPTYVNSFNDLFGFFITGANPAGGNYTGLNIATLPNGQYVSINNVNNGNTNTGPCVNCAYYVDNTNGTTIQYNGMTTVLTSSVWLVPCTTYHFKIAIADAIDCILDSGVFVDFLQCSTAFSVQQNSSPDQCNSCVGSATVNVTGGIPPYSYQWLPTGGNGATANNLCAGTYSVLVMDQSSCGIPDTEIVNISNVGSLAATVQQVNVSCNGGCNGTLDVTPQGGTAPFTYTWNPNVSNTNSATGLCAGQYVVDVADANGCSSTYTYNITEPAALSLALNGNNNVCAGVSTTINAAPAGGTGPYTVSWSNNLPNGNSATVAPNATTIYTATVTDSAGCTAQQTFTVTVNPSPVANFSTGPADCAPAFVAFTDSSVSATTYSWDFGDPLSGSNTSALQNPTHLYSTAGTYNVSLVVTGPGGCSDTLIIPNAVTVSPQPVAAFTVLNPVVSENDPTVIFTDQSQSGTGCVFYFGDGDSLNTCNFGTIDHAYPGPGTYQAMMIVSDATGCADTISMTIVVENESSFYVPNAFTPNGSGQNDVFYAYGSNIDNFDMLVFDRWGNLLFESHDINKGWDGTYKNQPCEEDVYVWKITYTNSHGEKKKAIGSVSLLK
ncbi:MAG TPA: choice-of-anchor L domain-containing protein [Bacteroidia bacterium]|nr:choice-of-anchor L domain-containing protein [Bacteroidia bacterium]